MDFLKQKEIPSGNLHLLMVPFLFFGGVCFLSEMSASLYQRFASIRTWWTLEQSTRILIKLARRSSSQVIRVLKNHWLCRCLWRHVKYIYTTYIWRYDTYLFLLLYCQNQKDMTLVDVSGGWSLSLSLFLQSNNIIYIYRYIGHIHVYVYMYVYI